jgi:putative tryptophan/tyrosine transport system substrate-binding protein
MRRREFIAGLGGAAVWPLTAGAQQPATVVVGFVYVGPADAPAGLAATFRKGLGESGYVEART